MRKRKRLDGHQLDDIKPAKPKPREATKFVASKPKFNERKDVVCITQELQDGDIAIKANDVTVLWFLQSGQILLKTRLQEEPIGDKFDLDDEGRIRT